MGNCIAEECMDDILKETIKNDSRFQPSMCDDHEDVRCRPPLRPFTFSDPPTPVSRSSSIPSMFTDIEVEDILAHELSPYLAEMLILDRHLVDSDKKNVKQDVFELVERGFDSENYNVKKYCMCHAALLMMHHAHENRQRQKKEIFETNIMIIFYTALLESHARAQSNIT